MPLEDGDNLISFNGYSADGSYIGDADQIIQIQAGETNLAVKNGEISEGDKVLVVTVGDKSFAIKSGAPNYLYWMTGDPTTIGDFGWTKTLIAEGLPDCLPKMRFDQEGYPHFMWIPHGGSTIYHRYQGDGGWTSERAELGNDRITFIVCQNGWDFRFDTGGVIHVAFWSKRRDTGDYDYQGVEYVKRAVDGTWSGQTTVHLNAYGSGFPAPTVFLDVDSSQVPHILHSNDDILNQCPVHHYYSSGSWNTENVTGLHDVYGVACMVAMGLDLYCMTYCYDRTYYYYPYWITYYKVVTYRKYGGTWAVWKDCEFEGLSNNYSNNVGAICRVAMSMVDGTHQLLSMVFDQIYYNVGGWKWDQPKGLYVQKYQGNFINWYTFYPDGDPDTLEIIIDAEHQDDTCWIAHGHDEYIYQSVRFNSRIEFTVYKESPYTWIHPAVTDAGLTHHLIVDGDKMPHLAVLTSALQE